MASSRYGTFRYGVRRYAELSAASAVLLPGHYLVLHSDVRTTGLPTTQRTLQVGESTRSLQLLPATLIIRTN